MEMGENSNCIAKGIKNENKAWLEAVGLFTF